MSENEENTLGSRLDYLLRKRGISRRKLGILVGSTGQTIADIIKGSNPKAELLDKIATTLGVSTEYLLKGETIDMKKASQDYLDQNPWLINTFGSKGDIDKLTWSIPINENSSPQALLKKIRQQEVIIEGLKKQVDSKTNKIIDLHNKIMELNDELMQELRKKQS